MNVQGTRAALEAAHANGARRFVYASTVWVYGGLNGNGHLYDEDTPLVLPNHFYTATKLAGEMYCRSYAELYGLEQTTLRFGIPYGPRSRAAAVVASFVARARAGEPLLVSGDGRQSRQFVYVEDLAGGVVAALSDSAPAGVYNLVDEEPVEHPGDRRARPGAGRAGPHRLHRGASRRSQAEPGVGASAPRATWAGAQRRGSTPGSGATSSG